METHLFVFPSPFFLSEMHLMYGTEILSIIIIDEPQCFVRICEPGLTYTPTCERTAISTGTNFKMFLVHTSRYCELGLTYAYL